jgi:hypothetical protein
MKDEVKCIMSYNNMLGLKEFSGIIISKIISRCVFKILKDNALQLSFKAQKQLSPSVFIIAHYN